MRGGGLYAVGYIASFLWFEARTLADEIAESSGVGDFLRSQIVEWFRDQGGSLRAEDFYNPENLRWNLPGEIPEDCQLSGM